MGGIGLAGKTSISLILAVATREHALFAYACAINASSAIGALFESHACQSVRIQEQTSGAGLALSCSSAAFQTGLRAGLASVSAGIRVCIIGALTINNALAIILRQVVGMSSIGLAGQAGISGVLASSTRE